jgi:Tol biopolymer transport system component
VRVARIVLFAMLVAAVSSAAAKAASTVRASVGPDGEQGNRASGEYGAPALSEHGRVVAFISRATNLVAGDDNEREDVFVRDMLSRRTTLLSTDGQPAPSNGSSVRRPSLSRDGRVVAWLGRLGECGRVYLHDRAGATTEIVPLGRDDEPESHLTVSDYALSPDGRYVASVTSGYSFGASCGEAHGDEGGAGFNEGAVTLYDRKARTTTTVDTGSLMRYGGEVALSRRARIVLITRFAGASEIYAIDRRTGRRTLVSVGPRGRRSGSPAVGANPVISADGRSVAFSSSAHFTRGDSERDDDVFVRDLRLGRTTRVSVGSGGAGLGESNSPSISADGWRIAFASSPRPDLTADVFLRDRKTRRTRLVSVARGGGRAGQSLYPAISGDGQVVALASAADDLVRGDTNRRLDVFLRGPFPLRR